jgi:subtilisin family serine protease
MSETKEYIVTCRNKEDLDSLYEDMETPGGNLYIPNREVELVSRRAISRNTHYMLSEEEAAQVKNDPRVLDCELTPEQLGIFPGTSRIQTGDFQKNTGIIGSDDKNWGLYRVSKGQTVANWGSDNVTQITNQTITATSTGKNVDVVIVDTHLNPNHPEFAVNPDGTGGSRVNQFNWFSYSSALGQVTPATYTYSTSGQSPNDNHATHVAGTVCGNTQGWAIDANIYNLTYSDALSGVTSWGTKLWDYLRYFHLNKPINPNIGRRNPTITNHSWGYRYDPINLSSITSVTYRGVTTTLTGTDAEKKIVLEANGVPVPFETYLWQVPARITSIDADIQDAINDGVIFIAAAMNSYWRVNTLGGSDYNNSFLSNPFTYFHSRGGSPGSAPNVICVGSVGSKRLEYKSNFSNWGERVDIWAPGSDIISSVYDLSSATSEGYGPLASDPRSGSYWLASVSGTSMATPQVSGVIACLAEQEPNLTQAEALQYLKESSLAEVGDPGSNPNSSPYEGFGNGNNRYLFYKKKRSEQGAIFPRVLNKNRNPNTNGVKYPRPRIKRTR